TSSRMPTVANIGRAAYHSAPRFTARGFVNPSSLEHGRAAARRLLVPGLFVAAAISLAACRAPPPAYDYQKEPDPRRQEYVVGVTDAWRIMVWKNPELSTEARVRPDGTITLPLIGDLPAAGRTPTQLRDEVTRRLGSFIKDESTTVLVAVVEVNSYRITV